MKIHRVFLSEKKEERKSISLLVEQWLTEKLFIKEPKFKDQS